MHLTFSLRNKPSIYLPFERYASTPAINLSNPYEAVGVLHNAIFDYIAAKLAAEQYYGSEPCLESVIRTTLKVVNDSRFWEINCICVTREGCPCRDFLDWILATFPSAPNESSSVISSVISKEDIPSQRPSRKEVEEVALSRLPGCDRDNFLPPLQELHKTIQRLSTKDSDIRAFQKAVINIEASILNSHIAPLAQQLLLTTTSVARHSLFLALSSGRDPAQVPGWVSSDADGATIGGAVGGIGGGAGIIPGALIGGGIFSLATATGFPGW